MNIEKFMDWTHIRQKQCSCLLAGVKNTEYSRNDDKLHNFKRAGDCKGRMIYKKQQRMFEPCWEV